MTNIVPRSVETPVSFSAGKTMRRMINATRIEQGAIRAITRIGEQAQFAVLEIKNTQHELELANPAAARELNIIAATVCTAIAASVQRFASEIG